MCPFKNKNRTENVLFSLENFFDFFIFLRVWRRSEGVAECDGPGLEY
jgi:hypothetical protein